MKTLKMLFAAALLAFTLGALPASAQTEPYYIKPQIDAAPALSLEGLPVSVSFRATTPVEIIWIKLVGNTYEEQPSGRGSFVFIPPSPGTYGVIVQTQDTLSPIYVAEVRKGWCWDINANGFVYRRGGFVWNPTTNRYDYHGRGWESDWRWFTVTPANFAGIANQAK